ncbi:GNAT family N-acetyltransferase [Ornithinibacillus salinisoli]|uniref:GNAT family N-acetyltransferase n=1 Tax=Ornithinibacillus salinisoli TaxID=1848459 RepID=A0ABW4W6D4_9BACI
MGSKYSIKRLDKRAKSSFVALMVSSFEKDPLFVYLFDDGDQNRFQYRARAFVSFLFDKSFFLFEEIWGIYDKGRLVGAYIIELPNVKRTDKIIGGLLLLSGIVKLMTKLSLSTIAKLNKYMKVSRSHVKNRRFHYLIMIGVLPAEQGKGIGAMLIFHILKQVNEEQNTNGIALDTENKNNVGYYYKLGFTLNSEHQFGDITIHRMIIIT